MAYTAKDWQDGTTHEIQGPSTTAISAVALEDMETRVTDYTDLKTAVSVMEPPYNATGNGITDDQAALQAALTAGAGATVVLPSSGTFMSSAPLSVPANTRVVSLGATLKATVWSGAVDAMLSLDGDGITIDGLRMDGNGVAQGAGDTNRVHLIKLGGAYDDITIRNCDFDDFFGYGVVAQTGPVNNLRIVNNTWRNGTSNGGTDLAACVSVQASGGGSGISFNGNRVVDVEGYACGLYATDADKYTDISMAENTISNITGIPLEINTVTHSERAAIVGNTVDGGKNGISVGACDYLTVSGNVVVDATTGGVELGGGGGSYQTITGNTFVGTSGPVITCIDATGSVDLVIANNTISGTTGGSSGGIMLQGPHKRISVTGNSIYDTANNSIILTNYGGGADPEDVLIANNRTYQPTSSGTTTGIQIGNGTRVTVKDNHLSAEQIADLWWVCPLAITGSTTDLLIEGNHILGVGGAPILHYGIQFSAGTATRCKVRRNRVYNFWYGIRTDSDGAGSGIELTENDCVNCTNPYELHASTVTTQDVPHALKIEGNVGFYGTTPGAKPEITGSAGANAALIDLLASLETLGLITDSSS